MERCSGSDEGDELRSGMPVTGLAATEVFESGAARRFNFRRYHGDIWAALHQQVLRIAVPPSISVVGDQVLGGGVP